MTIEGLSVSFTVWGAHGL